MLADDLPPTRLETAKKAINALVGKLHGDRIGLIAFAGSAFLVCPLTSDYDAFLQVLNESGSDTIPRGGTDFSALAKEVQNAFSGTDLHSRLLIVVSDGEDHGGFDVTSSRQLRESGMMICSITAGTEKGGIIPLPGGNFLKDRQGSLIHSRANPVTMDYFSSRNMKLEADGGTAIRLYDEVRPLLLQHTIKNSRQRYKERFQIPLAAALLLLCTEAFLACRVRI
jgi:Ca-activated chloride channel family protein